MSVVTTTLAKLMAPKWTLSDLNPVDWTFADAATSLFDKAIDSGPKTSITSEGVGYDLHGESSRTWSDKMNLDLQACSRARLTRDPRFDGKFFIGVVGSGVYCRSI